MILFRPHLRHRCLLFACLLLAAPVPATAQEEEQQPQAAQVLPPDSVFRQPPPLSPGGAFLRSLVIPGWAQSELGARTRGAFYFLVEAFSILMIARSQIRLDHARSAQPWDEGLIESREQQREDWIAIAVFTAFFSGADGFVSVHLWGFEDVTSIGPDVSAAVSFSIPFAP
jgi:hypothetical protein